MRRIFMMMLAGAALVAAFLVQAGPAQETSPKQAAKGPAKGSAVKGKSTAIPAGDWPMYSRDLTSSRYSPLKQITTANVSKLKSVWSYRPSGPAAAAPAADNAKGGGKGKGKGPARPAVVAESTPIVVNGVMYVPAGNQVVALDADTGKEIWTHQTTGGTVATRGIGYWPGDGSNSGASALHRRDEYVRAQCGYRQHRSWFRQRRRRRHRNRLGRCALCLQEPHHHGQQQRRAHRRPRRRHQSLRRPDRLRIVALQNDGSTG